MMQAGHRMMKEIGIYTVDGERVKDSVIDINGAYYGFDWDGKMYADTEFGASDVEGNW